MMEKWNNGLDLIGMCLNLNGNVIPILDPVFHRSNVPSSH